MALRGGERRDQMLISGSTERWAWKGGERTAGDQIRGCSCSPAKGVGPKAQQWESGLEDLHRDVHRT